MFPDKIYQPKGVEATSSFVADRGMVVDILEATTTYTLLFNGVEEVLPHAVSIGDLVELIAFTPAYENATEFVSYSLDDEPHTVAFTTTIDLDNQYFYQFKFVDQVVVQPNTLVQSTAFELYRLKEPVQIRLAPSVFGATLVQNGAPVGTEATGHNGDLFYVQYTSPLAYGQPVEFRVAVGSYVETYKARTRYLNQKVGDFAFPGVVGASLDTDYVSQPVYLSGFEGVQTVVCSTSFLHNGVERAAGSAEAVPGDSIRLKVRSSSSSGTPAYSTMTVGDAQGIFSEFAEFCVVTQVSIDNYRTTDSWAGNNLFNFSFSPAASRQLLVFDEDDTPTYVPLDISNIPAIESMALDSMLYWAVSPYEAKLYVVNSSDYSVQAAAVFPAGSLPSCVVSVPPNALPGEPNRKFVSMYNSSYITELDVDTLQPNSTYGVGSRPVHMASDTKGVLYIACQDSGLYVFNDTDSKEAAVRIDTQAGAVHCVIEEVGADTHCYVLYSSGWIKKFVNRVAVASINTYNQLTSGAVFNNALHVVACNSNRVLVLDKGLAAVGTFFFVSAYPYECSVHNNELWINHLGTNKVLVYDTDYNKREIVYTGGRCLGIGGGVGLVMYSNLPNVVSLPMVTSLDTSKVNQEVGSISSFDFTPNRNVVVQVGPGAVLKVAQAAVTNGVSYVLAGSAVSIEVVNSDAPGHTVEATVVIDGTVYGLSSTTAFDTLPDFLDFGGEFNLHRRTQIESPALEVTGITPGAAVSLKYEHDFGYSSLVVNGEVLDSDEAVVTLGDTVALVSTVEGVAASVITYHLTAGGEVVGSYVLGTKVLEGPVKGLESPYFDLTSSLDTNGTATPYYNAHSFSDFNAPSEGSVGVTSGVVPTLLSAQPSGNVDRSARPSVAEVDRGTVSGTSAFYLSPCYDSYVIDPAVRMEVTPAYTAVLGQPSVLCSSPLPEILRNSLHVPAIAALFSARMYTNFITLPAPKVEGVRDVVVFQHKASPAYAQYDKVVQHKVPPLYAQYTKVEQHKASPWYERGTYVFQHTDDPRYVQNWAWKHNLFDQPWARSSRIRFEKGTPAYREGPKVVGVEYAPSFVPLLPHPLVTYSPEFLAQRLELGVLYSPRAIKLDAVQLRAVTPEGVSDVWWRYHLGSNSMFVQDAAYRVTGAPAVFEAVATEVHRDLRPPVGLYDTGQQALEAALAEYPVEASVVETHVFDGRTTYVVPSEEVVVCEVPVVRIAIAGYISGG